MKTREFRAALTDAIEAEPSVSQHLASADSVYHAVAPDDAEFPFVVFNKQSSRAVYTFGDKAWDDSLWQIKVIDRNTESNAVDDAAEALDELLTDGSLAISGGTLVYMRRESDVDFVEVDNGQQFRHSGALYRIYVRD